MTSLLLLDRKAILGGIVPKDSSLFAKTKFFEGNGEAHFEAVKGQAHEGIVLKRKDSRYEFGKRSHSWWKVVYYQFAEVNTIGYRTSGNFG